MNMIPTTVRFWAMWMAPLALFVLLIGWQTDWGREWTRVPPAVATAVPPPVTVTVLPPYVPDATVESSRDTIDRTLFNPTRRPAPVAIAEAQKPRMQRGQFALTGTLLVEGKATAFLRDVNGGKARRVLQGETVNGLLVAEVKANSVRLTQGEEAEELVLKLAVGPRTTIQPVVAAPASGAALAAAAGLSPAEAARIAPQVRDVADVLAERRRTARAAEAAAAGLPPGAPIPATAAPPVAAPTTAPAGAAAAGSTDPAWASVYQRYQQPRR